MSPYKVVGKISPHKMRVRRASEAVFANTGDSGYADTRHSIRRRPAAG
ncbi:hypothetical protein HMPREF1022_02459 [Desulfovibrio sp. 6_1_46AFAA]|nr:hypothetical protein HMPREF1022_02459 [Desulfovibrio sp. 6_1_46AFAA]EQN50733.1 hypothetical protein HMPREF0326_05590 [Desulfovibrio sp. 3_1_syn3]